LDSHASWQPGIGLESFAHLSDFGDKVSESANREMTDCDIPVCRSRHECSSRIDHDMSAFGNDVIMICAAGNLAD